MYVLLSILFLILGAIFLDQGRFFDQGIAGEFYQDNLLPELVGFCAEGLLFVGLLTIFQRHEQRRHKRITKDLLDRRCATLQLRTYFTIFGHQPITTNPEWQNRIKAWLDSDDGFDEGVLDDMFRMASVELDNHRALYDTAVNMESGVHIVCWDLMLQALEGIESLSYSFENHGVCECEITPHLKEFVRLYFGYGEEFRLSKVGSSLASDWGDKIIFPISFSEETEHARECNKKMQPTPKGAG